MRTILTNREISIPARLRFIKCYVWSRFLFGVETWTISKMAQQRLNAFKMQTFRRMLQISLTGRITNEKVIRMECSKRSLFDTVKKRKLSFFGYVMRHNSLQKDLLQALVEGKCGEGMPKLQWSKNITRWTGLTFEKAKRTAQDRKKKRILITFIDFHTNSFSIPSVEPHSFLYVYHVQCYIMVSISEHT